MIETIERFQTIPYMRGEGRWAGADCWGLCELWYQELYGIDLSDRGEISPGPSGLQTGYDNAADWSRVEQPIEGDLVVMSTVIERVKLNAGHIGIFTQGGVLHTDKNINCVWQLLTDRLISRRITGFLHHAER